MLYFPLAVASLAEWLHEVSLSDVDVVYEVLQLLADRSLRSERAACLQFCRLTGPFVRAASAESADFLPARRRVEGVQGEFVLLNDGVRCQRQIALAIRRRASPHSEPLTDGRPSHCSARIALQLRRYVTENRQIVTEALSAWRHPADEHKPPTHPFSASPLQERACIVWQ